MKDFSDIKLSKILCEGNHAVDFLAMSGLDRLKTLFRLLNSSCVGTILLWCILVIVNDSLDLPKTKKYLSTFG